jgi:hypothetical protein
VSGYLTSNRRGLERIGLLAKLGREELSAAVPDGWTVAATLAHLAHWDGWVAARWDLFRRVGVFESMPDSLMDLTNSAGLPVWLAVDPARAAQLAFAAAEAVVRLIEELREAEVRQALATGREFMLDRTPHWDGHLDAIDTALARNTARRRDS